LIIKTATSGPTQMAIFSKTNLLVNLLFTLATTRPASSDRRTCYARGLWEKMKGQV